MTDSLFAKMETTEIINTETDPEEQENNLEENVNAVQSSTDQSKECPASLSSPKGCDDTMDLIPTFSSEPTNGTQTKYDMHTNANESSSDIKTNSVSTSLSVDVGNKEETVLVNAETDVDEKSTDKLSTAFVKDSLSDEQLKVPCDLAKDSSSLEENNLNDSEKNNLDDSEKKNLNDSEKKNPDDSEKKNPDDSEKKNPDDSEKKNPDDSEKKNPDDSEKNNPDDSEKNNPDDSEKNNTNESEKNNTHESEKNNPSHSEKNLNKNNSSVLEKDNQHNPQKHLSGDSNLVSSCEFANTNTINVDNSNNPSTSEEKRNQVDGGSPIVSHKCEKCMYEASDKVLFDLHVCKGKVAYEKGQQKEIKITCEGDLFLCGECGYSGQGHGFEEHLMCHLLLRPYQCIYCQESFINRKEIGKHVGVAHPGKKLNCALKAMKKAKSFMAETRKNGSYRFFARVSGQVPLGISFPKPFPNTPSKSNETKSLDTNTNKLCTSIDISDTEKVSRLPDKSMDEITIPQAHGSIHNDQLRLTTNENNDENSTKFIEKSSEENDEISSDLDLDKSNDKSPDSNLSRYETSLETNIEDNSIKSNEVNFIPDSTDKQISVSETSISSVQNSTFEDTGDKDVESSVISNMETSHDHINPILESEEPGENNGSMALKIVASFSLNECPMANIHVPTSNINVDLSMTTNSTNVVEETSVSTFETPLVPQLTVKEVLSTVKKTNKCTNFYACGFLCDFNCLTSAEFKDHLLKEHVGSSTYPCSHCGWTTQSEDGLLKHVTAHAHAYNKTLPLYFCGFTKCRFGTNLLTEFVNHMNILHTGACEHKCKECNCVFDNITKLLQHFEDNFLHVVNCPHCTAKAQNRKVILNHIASSHPGKPKMVSVGKQIICKDRKMHSFHQLKGLISNVRRSSSSANLEHLLNLEKQLPHFLSSNRSDAFETPADQSSDLVTPATENEEDHHEAAEPFEEDESLEERSPSFIKTEQYDRDQPSPANSAEIPESNLKQSDQITKCNFCTFVARDVARLNGHKTCHSVGGDGRQHAKKQRFKCPYCPQCFENLTKFSAHASCHPGLIKFNLYTCKHCEYNSNQKHVILNHIEVKCGRNYSGLIEDLLEVEEKLLESRVLECENCSYQTRHKIHLKVHYESVHKTLLNDTLPAKKSLSSQNEHQITTLSPDELPAIMDSSASSSRENLVKKFMCPVCFYLLPKGADLKKHIRKHPELGKVSLVLFRCRYCSCASTAKHVIASHIKTKHPGRNIALVKKVISVDTRDTDNSFSETQVSETPMSISESEVNSILMNSQKASVPPSETEQEDKETYHHIFIVPEYSHGNFAAPVKCPCCSFASQGTSALIQHMKMEHPHLCVVGKQLKPVLRYYKLGSEVPFGLLSLLQVSVGIKSEVVILSYKDVFSISAQCPKCVFSTYFKQNLALHMRDHHKELSILEAHKEEIKPSPKKSPLSKSTPSLAKMQQLRKQDPIIVGSGILDDKLKGLYENLGFVSRCAICGTERPKRYHMHVHVLRHLNVALWKCQYCDYKGLERYKMCKHIKDQHPQKKMAIKYLPVDIEDKITEYLNERSAAAANGEEVPTTKVSPGAKYSMDAAFSPLGNDDIDEHLKELYREQGEFFCCILCSFTVRRKFAIHRHIVSSHLAIALVGCGYCGFRGIDRKSIVDHSHEQHPQSTLNVILLPNHLKNIVSDCLSSSGLKEEANVPTPLAEMTVKFPESTKPKQKARKSFPVPKSIMMSPTTDDTLPEVASPSSEPVLKKYVMGTEVLDSKLRMLYSTGQGKFKCTICENDFPRRYAIHRHILMCHLKVGLMQCPLCSFSGVERYIVMNHLKEHHKVDDQIPFPCEVDIDDKISTFLSQELSGVNRTRTKVRRGPKDASARGPVKATNGTDHFHATSNKPMVVALFNKRKSVPDENKILDLGVKKIKQEIMEEGNDEYQSEQSEESLDNTDEPAEKSSDGLGEESEEPEDEKEDADTDVQENASVFKARAMTDVATKIQVINLSDRYSKRFGCGKCSFVSVHRANILRHIFRVHENYRYKICKICGYKTLSNVLMRKHINEKHEKVAENNIMYEELNSDKLRMKKAEVAKTNFPEVSNKKGLYACAYCSFETNTSDNMVKHIEKSHSKGSKESAGKKKPEPQIKGLKSKAKLKAPVLRIPTFFAKHEALKKKCYKCEFCDFQCRIYRLLKSHVALVHKDRPKAVETLSPKPSWKFACIECHLKMDVGTKMKCHLGRHIGYKPFVCETCTADFASPDEMRKHIRRYQHSEKMNYVKQDGPEEKLEGLLIKCKKYANDIIEGRVPNQNPNRVGQRIMKKKSELLASQSNEDSPKNKKLKLDGSSSNSDSKGKMTTKGFGCSLCIYTGESIHEVSTHHVRVHRNLPFMWKDIVMGYTCDVNGYIKESERPLPKTKPVLFKTTGDKIPLYTCIKCGFSTTSLQGVIGHVKAHGTRDYLCAYCSNRYFKRMMLARHQKSIHKGKRLWLVHQSTEEPIGKSETDNQPLSERPSTTNLNYCCHLCSFVAESLYQYRLHLPTHGQCDHLVPDIAADSPLKCGYCAYVAPDQKDFSAHINMHLNHRSFKCQFCDYSAYNKKDVASHLRYLHDDVDLSNEYKYIISAKDTTKLRNIDESQCRLPMLVDLDPRVQLVDCSRLDFVDMVSKETENTASSSSVVSKEKVTSVTDEEDSFETEGLLSNISCESQDAEVKIAVKEEKPDFMPQTGIHIDSLMPGIVELDDNDPLNLDDIVSKGDSNSFDEVDGVSCDSSVLNITSIDDTHEEREETDLEAFDSIDQALAQINTNSEQSCEISNSNTFDRKKNLFETFSAENPSFT